MRSMNRLNHTLLLILSLVGFSQLAATPPSALAAAFLAPASAASNRRGELITVGSAADAIIPPESVGLDGPTLAKIGSAYPFTATVSPITATVPITYVWEATGQAPVTHTNGLNDNVFFTWDTPGNVTISVTAMNPGGVVTNTQVINLFSPETFLPFATRSCPPLYADDFSNPASGWHVGDVGNVRWEYLSGEYRILVRAADWSAGTAPGFTASDFTAAVDVRNAAGTVGSYGLLFGLSNDWSQFYSFEVTPDGHYGLFRYAGGWASLAGGSSSALLTGTATNRLKLQRSGATINAYANDQLLASATDGAFTGMRRIGLTASTYGQPTLDTDFDNFTVYAPNCAGATAPASLPAGAGNPNRFSAANDISRWGAHDPTAPLSTRPMSLPREAYAIHPN